MYLTYIQHTKFVIHQHAIKVHTRKFCGISKYQKSSYTTLQNDIHEAVTQPITAATCTVFYHLNTKM
jgi:hypothetical protein